MLDRLAAIKLALRMLRGPPTRQRLLIAELATHVANLKAALGSADVEEAARLRELRMEETKEELRSIEEQLAEIISMDRRAAIRKTNLIRTSDFDILLQELNALTQLDEKALEAADAELRELEAKQSSQLFTVTAQLDSQPDRATSAEE